MNKLKFTMFLLIMSLVMVAYGCSTSEVSSELNGKVNATENIEDVNVNQEETEAGINKDKPENKVETAVVENKKENKVNSINPSGTMEVHFIDVGQADSALITYDDHAILIDAGDWNKNEVVPYLKSKGVEKLDLVVGSHPHADHIGQMDKVINTFPVDEVWMSGGENTSNVMLRTLESIEKNGANYEEPKAGESYQIGDLVIDVISPRKLTGNLNDDSIVMKLTYGTVSFLFEGDAEIPSEKNMIASGQDLSATILKVGHHGSDTSTSQDFLNKVNPEVAVMSVAEKSKYNHPNKSIVDRLSSKGVETYATKTHGNVVIKTDGKTYTVSKDKDGKIIPGDIGEQTQKPTTVPEKTESTSANSSAGEKQPVKVETVSGCVDINSVSEEELQNIKHIGPATASKIISKRPFESVDNLTKVNGIGPKKIEDIKAEGKACVK